MNILITGAQGFVGQNLAASLEAYRDGKDTAHQIQGLDNPSGLTILRYDKNNTPEELDEYCAGADFVFHLAGVNRPENPEEYMQGNFGFSSLLLDTLKKRRNTCPVMLSSSVQASLAGRYAGSAYGKSKLMGEELFRSYGAETGAKVLIYRFPNLFGKWCRPNYNSAVATFCHNMANGLPIKVNDRNTELELVYIDDVVEEFFRALNGEEHCSGAEHCSVEECKGREECRSGEKHHGREGFCYIPECHHATLGEIADLLGEFRKSRENRTVPDMTPGSFSKKLYAAYLSYLPADRLSYSLKASEDARGSFTEILRTPDRGQFSVNTSRPGVTKGQHWHHTKNEKFLVVSGAGLIRLRKIGTDPETKRPYQAVEYPVCGTDRTVVEMIPGYTHSIINTSDTEDLVTVMWCSECFDPERPDTYFEEV